MYVWFYILARNQTSEIWNKTYVAFSNVLSVLAEKTQPISNDDSSYKLSLYIYLKLDFCKWNWKLNLFLLFISLAYSQNGFKIFQGSLKRLILLFLKSFKILNFDIVSYKCFKRFNVQPLIAVSFFCKYMVEYISQWSLLSCPICQIK